MLINILGGGLAGSEAAYFLAKKGYQVNLYEMKPDKFSPAHTNANLGELVCSNSLKSISLASGHGLLKEEMRLFGSLILEAADYSSVPAGQALAVDRDIFAEYITTKLKETEGISINNNEITDIKPFLMNNEHITVIATGPLTSEPLFYSMKEIFGEQSLHFFDAAAPIVSAESLDMDKLFFQTRYDKGEPDYLNSAMDQNLYYSFVDELIKAEKSVPRDFEEKMLFEGCMPVESIALRGRETLAFGTMKPVGIVDPVTGVTPYAVVQLRAENRERTMYNLVGFQTKLKWAEQKRVFSMIPGLENAEFLRYGVIHKNIFFNSPKILDPQTISANNLSNIYFAGQITGVEGYCESSASGIYTAYAIDKRIKGECVYLPEDTMMGALQRYTVTENKNYQPMASNFGLLTGKIDVPRKIKGSDKKKFISEQALISMKKFINAD